MLLPVRFCDDPAQLAGRIMRARCFTALRR
jgi:hypothetical protein